jgi:hypothetical protein
MEPRININPLGLVDPQRTINNFRPGLKLPNNIQEGEGIAFFQFASTWQALYPSDPLAEDARIPPERAHFGGGYTGSQRLEQRKSKLGYRARTGFWYCHPQTRYRTFLGLFLRIFLRPGLPSLGGSAGIPIFLWSEIR